MSKIENTKESENELMNAFKQLQVSIQQLNLRAILQSGINVKME